jgi:biopolymer transport protein ExbB/TolQ
MKSDTLTTVLNFVLAALVLLGVVFALLTIIRVREYRALSLQANFANNALMRLQSLANDTAAYNQTKQDPGIARLLQSIQNKPAAK